MELKISMDGNTSSILFVMSICATLLLFLYMFFYFGP